MTVQPFLNLLIMASIFEVAKIVHDIASGLEAECVKCLEQNKGEVVDSIREQLYSGLDGDENSLSPTYDDDSFFQKTKGRWRNDPDGYKAWKKDITPPVVSSELNLPARPENVPNLFITGTFHDSIYAESKGEGLFIGTKGFRDGPLIEKKYGKQIFTMGNTAKEYFNIMFLRPWINDFFKRCGYR